MAAGNDGALSDEDRASLAEQLSGLKDQLVGIGNTKDGVGRYVLLVSKQINHLLLLTKRVKSPTKVETSKLLKS